MASSIGERTIVITGCSSGFGRVTALNLAQQGWRVFATVRRQTGAEDLLADKWLFDVTERFARKVSTGREGFPPSLFADTVRKILASPRPRARYVIPRSASRQMLLRRLLPDRTWDWLLRRTLKW